MFSLKPRLKHLFLQKHKDIFSAISGHDDIKLLLTSALNSEEAVHILLVGKPGLGKTQFLEAIEKKYENSYLVLGSGSTAAGMINACFERKPRFLPPQRYTCCSMRGSYGYHFALLF